MSASNRRQFGHNEHVPAFSGGLGPRKLGRAATTSARIRRAALVVVALVVILFAGNAVARPGCSLLPVELPADPNRTLPGGTRAQACAALGRPMPEARNLPLGLHETALTVEGPPPVGADTHRRVSVFYAIETSNLVELTSQRATSSRRATARRTGW